MDSAFCAYQIMCILAERHLSSNVRWKYVSRLRNKRQFNTARMTCVRADLNQPTAGSLGRGSKSDMLLRQSLPFTAINRTATGQPLFVESVAYFPFAVYYS
jgi:hypothetical protein